LLYQQKYYTHILLKIKSNDDDRICVLLYLLSKRSSVAELSEFRRAAFVVLCGGHSFEKERGNFSSFASPRGSGASLFRALPGRTPLAAAKHHPGNPFASLSKHCATRKN
jgi:hypothetical protein